MTKTARKTEQRQSERTEYGEDTLVADTDQLVDERQCKLWSGFDAVRRIAGAVTFID